MIIKPPTWWKRKQKEQIAKAKKQIAKLHKQAAINKV